MASSANSSASLPKKTIVDGSGISPKLMRDVVIRSKRSGSHICCGGADDTGDNIDCPEDLAVTLMLKVNGVHSSTARAADWIVFRYRMIGPSKNRGAKW